MTDPAAPASAGGATEPPASAAASGATEPSGDEAEADLEALSSSIAAVASEQARLVDLPRAIDLPPNDPTVSFAFNLGKIAGQGEDSDPILRVGRDVGIVAVFDGMGGAGGTVYQTPEGPRTGAYLASRIARDVAEAHLVEALRPDSGLDADATAADLHAVVQGALQARLADLHAPRSGLRSKLLRALPTTMALVALHKADPAASAWKADVFWAGDSRAYVFEPGSGAHQLTTDDLREPGDAMANLREDSVVSNAMSADTEFVVRRRTVAFSAPFLVIAATDGCFGYVPSPMHFEQLILSTLCDADTAEEWSERLQRQVSAVTGDDAAMAALGVGADHEGLQRLFADRAALLSAEVVGPLDELAAAVERAEQALEAARDEHRVRAQDLWGAYKPAYQRYFEPTAVQEDG